MKEQVQSHKGGNITESNKKEAVENHDRLREIKLNFTEVNIKEC